MVADGRDMRVCARDGEPLVFTMEFAHAEWYCVVCEGKEDLFGARAPATEQRVRRHSELTEVYERARAERRGVEYVASPKVGDEGVLIPTCGGCGARPPEGVTLDGDKPASWYSKTEDGVTSYACSRACIPERESVMPW